MSKLFIVTGANGHLGNTLVKMLINQNFNIRALILKGDSKKHLKNSMVQIYEGDVRDKNSLLPLFDLCNTEYTYKDVVLVHTAGIVSISSKKHQLMYDVNVNGTKNIVDLALENHIGKLIYISSVHALKELPIDETIKETLVFDPDLVYGTYAKTKAIATKYVVEKMNEGLNAIIIHPSGIIGPNDYGHAHMTMMIEDYLNGFLTSRVNGAYDFVDVRDVSKAIIQAANQYKIKTNYIISGHYINLKDLFEHLKIISGKKLRINVLPMWFAKLTAPLAEIFYKIRKLPPIYSKYSLYTLNSNANFSREKARIDLNYQPRPIEETLYDTMMFLIDENRIKRYRVIHFIKSLKSYKKTGK
jgi:dihydroflavonol-4-reductase